MKRLWLIRHAKSSWKYPDLADHERPLNKRGKRDSRIMASYLSDLSENIDLLYTSSAVRARRYAKIIAKSCDLELIQKAELYTFSNAKLLAEIASFNNKYNNIALVGHNPAVTSLVNYFLSDREVSNVPTSAIAAFSFNSNDWHLVAQGEALSQLDYFMSPKLLALNSEN